MAYTTVTLADLKVILADHYDGVAFWTPEEARLAWNEALRDWNVLTGTWRGELVLTLAASTWEYSLGATLTYGMAVHGAFGALVPCSILDMDLGRPTWRQEHLGTGGDVPTEHTYWAPISLQQIAIWPALAPGGSGTLTVEGVAVTPVLTEDGDTVDLGDETQDVLADYALHVIAFKLGGPAWRATLPYFDAMLEAAAEENGRLKANQKFRRAAGLDRRRDLQPSKGVATQLDGLAFGEAR